MYLEQVVNTPGQDDNVVNIQQGHNHNGGVANTWKKKKKRYVVMLQKAARRGLCFFFLLYGNAFLHLIYTG